MLNVVLLFIFSFFFLVDVVVDLREGIPFSHVLHEVLLVLAGIAAIIWQLRVIWSKEKRIDNLNTELLETKKEYQDWKEKSHRNASEIRNLIDEQFEKWQLSLSEKEVALLLIKGFSMKEIADLRQTQEKTVRQQATAIYRKSALSGRQELAAFFLEDILSSP
ncbi:MAG: helix-turn-helix transcriptional regulator [Bacteriovoracaceae bacterium]